MPVLRPRTGWQQRAEIAAELLEQTLVSARRGPRSGSVAAPGDASVRDEREPCREKWTSWRSWSPYTFWLHVTYHGFPTFSNRYADEGNPGSCVTRRTLSVMTETKSETMMMRATSRPSSDRTRAAASC